MAVTIKLKNASGSDPSASDLVVGEVAIRTDNGKLFTKKDNGSVAEITGGGGIDDGDKGDITVSNSGATFTIDNDAVTYAKIQNVSATNRILGRDSSGAGVIEEITPANLRTMINVEDGATADQTASEILTLIKTVDGAGSGLDADTLDGVSSASFLRSDADDSASGTLSLNGRVNIGDSLSRPGALDSDADAHCKIGGSDVHLYFASLGAGGGYKFAVQAARDTDFSSFTLNLQSNGGDLERGGNKVWDAGNDGSGSGLDADLLDGQEGSYYRNASNINSGTLAAARVATLNQDTTGSAATLTTARNIGGVSFDGSANINLPGVNTSGNQDTSGNAATATKLATARTIAGVSFDGSANISLNNNAITNGAGYITATLTNEQVQDIVGAMVTGNTESGITVTYQDGDGTLDFSVASQTDQNFTTTLKNKLDGIAAGATNVTNNNQLTNGAGYITSDSTKMPLTGGEFTGDVICHTIRPDNNNQRDLGTSSKRFANLYVNDMHFANSPENVNKVDGTWGDWTLQEGEDQIYMLNNRNGKKYKMNLTEIV